MDLNLPIINQPSNKEKIGMKNGELGIRLTGTRKPAAGGFPRISTISFEVNGKTSYEKFNDNITIWRYMNLPKFVSMLSSQGLWFSRLDKLGDPYEGAAPGSDLARRKNDKDSMDIERVRNASRKWYVASSWYIHTYESKAMWELYAPRGEGIAIVSKAGILRDALSTSSQQYADSNNNIKVPLPEIFMGSVIYVYHDQTILEGDNAFGRYFLKDLSFKHENEFRVIAPLPDLVRDEGVNTKDEPNYSGVSVVIDLNKVITEIVVSPIAPKWYVKSIESLVNKFGVKSVVRPSDLAKPPKY